MGRVKVSDEGLVMTRVALIFGGVSTEHDISCKSADNVVSALDGRFELVLVGITRDGRWLRYAGDPAELTGSWEGHDCTPVALLPGSGLVELAEGGATRPLAVDVALPVLHGQGGEDGTVQGALEVVDGGEQRGDAVAQAVLIAVGAAGLIAALEVLEVRLRAAQGIEILVALFDRRLQRVAPFVDRGFLRLVLRLDNRLLHGFVRRGFRLRRRGVLFFILLHDFRPFIFGPRAFRSARAP